MSAIPGKEVEIRKTSGEVETVKIPVEMPWMLYQKIQKKIDATVEFDKDNNRNTKVRQAGKVAAEVQNTIISYLVDHGKYCKDLQMEDLTKSAGRKLVEPFEEELKDIGFNLKKK